MLQLHHLEKAKTMAHIKHVREIIFQEIEHIKGSMTRLLDGESLDADTVKALESSPAFLADNDLPRCDKGCLMCFDDGTGANGGAAYQNGEWICDKCDSSSSGARWSCRRCEYDMCLKCAGSSTVDLQVWPERQNLIRNVEQLSRQWWLDPRTDVSNPASTSKRSRSQLSPQAQARSSKKARRSGAQAAGNSSIGAFGGRCMGPELVHKAIEVLWEDDNIWYAGYVAAYRKGHLNVRYNNGEMEWIQLYERMDNGIEWRLLPQSTLPWGHARRPTVRATNADVRQYKGVRVTQGRYEAFVSLPSNSEVSLGFFDTAEQAAQVYDSGARLYMGCAARRNFRSLPPSPVKPEPSAGTK